MRGCGSITRREVYMNRISAPTFALFCCAMALAACDNDVADLGRPLPQINPHN